MNRIDWLALGFVVLVMGAVMDTVTTWYGITNYGLHAEANPFVRDMIGAVGLWFLPLGKVVVILFCIWFIKEFRNDEWAMRWTPLVLFAGGLWWTILGINNLWQVGLIG